MCWTLINSIGETTILHPMPRRRNQCHHPKFWRHLIWLPLVGPVWFGRSARSQRGSEDVAVMLRWAGLDWAGRKFSQVDRNAAQSDDLPLVLFFLFFEKKRWDFFTGQCTVDLLLSSTVVKAKHAYVVLGRLWFLFFLEESQEHYIKPRGMVIENKSYKSIRPKQKVHKKIRDYVIL